MNRNQLPKSKPLSEQAKLYKATDKGKPLIYVNRMSKKERELFLNKLRENKISSHIQLVLVFILMLVAVILFAFLVSG